MNNLLHMGSALYRHLNLGTVPTYYGKAPQDVRTPFCVIQFVTGLDDYVFGGKGLEADYMIKVVSSWKFADESINLYGYVHELAQDGTINIAGNKLLRLRRDSLINYQDQDGFWHTGGIYNLDTWELN